MQKTQGPEPWNAIVIFRAARAMERAIADLREGRRMDVEDAMTKDEFMKLVGLESWQEVEKTFQR